jgi:hypothetical protein
MKNVSLGVIGFVLVATAVGAYSADEHTSGSPMRGMMRGMKGMMGEQKREYQSHDMQGMKEMMGRMSKMMDMCGQMMASVSDPKKNQPSK